MIDMLLLLSLLSVLMTAAGWLALFMEARLVTIGVVASTGPIIAIWSLFYTAECRRLQRGEPSPLSPVGAALTGGTALGIAIAILSVTVAVLGPIVGLTGIWHKKLPEITPLLLWLAVLTPWSLLALLQSLGASSGSEDVRVTDEMMAQIQGKAAFRALVAENALLLACIIATGIAECSREITFTAFYALMPFGVFYYIGSCHRQCRRMVA